MKYHSYNPNDPIYPKIVDFINEKRIRSVLDVGCADGFLIDLIKEKCQGVKVIKGVEIDRNLAGNHPDIVIGDILKIPLRQKFELVIAKDIIEHVPNAVKAINELRRVSSKYIFISAPGPFTDAAWADYQHVRPYTKSTLKHIAHDFSLKIVKLGSIKRHLPFRIIAFLWMQPIDDIAVYSFFKKVL